MHLRESTFGVCGIGGCDGSVAGVRIGQLCATVPMPTVFGNQFFGNQHIYKVQTDGFVKQNHNSGAAALQFGVPHYVEVFGDLSPKDHHWIRMLLLTPILYQKDP